MTVTIVMADAKPLAKPLPGAGEDNPSCAGMEAMANNGGEENVCGWCKDRFGLSWQIVPRALLRAFADPDKAGAKRAMDAMMGMKRIDIATIERALAGGPVS